MPDGGKIVALMKTDPGERSRLMLSVPTTEPTARETSSFSDLTRVVVRD